MKCLKDLEACGVVGRNANGQHGDELLPRESWELANKEKSELEDVVKQKAKRLLRLHWQ
jgi:mitotic spindle assembly checkpoint protein MAD1